MPPFRRRDYSGDKWCYLMGVLLFYFWFLHDPVIEISVGPFFMNPQRMVLLLSISVVVMRLALNPNIPLWRGQFSLMLLIAMMALVMSSLMSLAYVNDLESAVRYTVFIGFQAAFTIVGLHILATHSGMKGASTGFLLAITTHVMTILFVYIVGDNFPQSRYYGAEGVSTGLFFNENDAAASLMISLPFMGAILLTRGGYLRWLGFSAYCVFVIWYTTYARSILGALSLFFLVLLVGFIFGIRIFRGISKRRQAGLLVMGGALILSIVPVALYILGNTETAIDQLRNDYGSVGVRLALIKEGIIELVGSGGFGLGAGQFQHAMLDLVTETRGVVDPHNLWLELVVNNGLLAGVLIPISVAAVGVAGFSASMNARAMDVVVMGSAVAAASYSIFTMSGVPSSAITLNPVWAAVVMSTGLVFYVRNPEELARVYGTASRYLSALSHERLSK